MRLLNSLSLETATDDACLMDIGQLIILGLVVTFLFMGALID